MLYNLREEGSDTLELDIFENIGEGGFFFSALSAQQVRNRLKARADAKTIRVTINSKGGEVMEGLAIYEDLRSHAARVEVKIQALAASIASVIAMAGDEITIAPTGFLMMHGVTGGARGNADFLEDTAEAMRKAQAAIAGVYQRRSKQPIEKINAWLSRDTYMTAEEALANGFVDRIDEKITTPKAQAQAFAMFNSATLDDAPPALLEAIRGAQAASAPPAIAAPTEPTPPPAPPAPESKITPEQPENRTMTEPAKTPEATPSVARALGLPPGSTETDIVASCGRLRELELQILAITGVVQSNEALGAIRALKASADSAEKLREENAELKATRDQQEFDALILSGTSQPIKLSPKSVEHYRERFLAAKERGVQSDVVADLRGFLKTASPIIAERKQPPKGEGGGGASPLWNGKTYAQLSFGQRAKLKQENAELWALMKREWEEAGSPNAAA